jgi:phosphotransacetylase
MYANFEELQSKLLNTKDNIKRIVVAGANDEHTLDAAFKAQKKGYTTPVLVGDKDKILNLIKKLNFANEPYKIVHCDNEQNPSSVAVKLIHENKGDFILKGKIQTGNFLKPILDKNTGLNSNNFITHFGLMQLKGYHKLLAMSDSAVIPHPTLENKIKIAKEGINTLNKLGYKNPVVAALCAVEKVNTKMPETIDAFKLHDISKRGDLGKGFVLGPISYDLATQKESAEIKGYKSEYSGNVDMLLVPDMVTGNIMSKIWNADENNLLAGCLIGTDIPIGLTSRSASMNEKLTSILLCSLLCNKKQIN